MKKIILSLSLVLSTTAAVFAVSPVAIENPIFEPGIAMAVNACKYHTSMQFYYYNSSGTPVYYGPYYFFNSVSDAFSYMLIYGPSNGGGTIICTKEVVGGI